MGILDKFATDASVMKPTVTVSFDPPDAVRVIDVVTAMKSKGCKNRGEFCRLAILEAVGEVEKAFGGQAKVKAAADKADPDGQRHVRRTRASNGKPAATAKPKQAAKSA